MKRYLIGGIIAGLATGFGAYKIYDELRFRREERELNDLFGQAAEDDESEPQPNFNVGDSVLVVDPNMADMGDLIEVPRPHTVTKIAYVQNLDTFTYQLDDEPYWYNENWLMPDIYGPKTWQVQVLSEEGDDMPKEKDGNKREIDYWLDSYTYEQSQGNEAGMNEAIENIRRLVNDKNESETEQ